MKVEAHVLLGAARHMNSLFDNAGPGSVQPPQIPSTAAGSAWEDRAVTGWKECVAALNPEDVRAIIQQAAHLAMLAVVAAKDGLIP